MRQHIIAGMVVVSILGAVVSSSYATTAYDNATGVTGLQAFGNSLGLDFTVNSPITITDLGVFNDGATSLLNGPNTTADMDPSSTSDPIGGTAAVLYDLTTDTIIAGPVYFSSTDTGTQDNGDAFKSITPKTLTGGSFSIVGWNTNNYNSSGAANNTVTLNSGGGAISFIGLARNAAGFTFPNSPDGGPVARYDTATFKFTATPEPTSLTMLAAGGGGMMMLRNRRRRS